MACFWQAHKTFNSIKVIDTLRKTATFSLTPNNSRGWGTPNMCSVPIVSGLSNPTAEFNNSVVLAPNPFTNSINVSLINGGFCKTAAVQVYNAIGVLINPITSQQTNSIVQLDFYNQPAGIYFLKICTTNGTVIKKVIKQ